MCLFKVLSKKYPNTKLIYTFKVPVFYCSLVHYNSEGNAFFAGFSLWRFRCGFLNHTFYCDSVNYFLLCKFFSVFTVNMI